MNLKRIFFTIVATTAMIVSCSKEDDTKEPINQTGGEVFRSQIVNVDTGNNALEENEYDATFNGQNVKVLKTEDNKLSFFIPYTTPLGNQDLIIPSLNATIHYTVMDVVLAASPEETMEPLLGNMETFTQTLDDSQESIDIKGTLESFNNYFDNATAEEKKQMAVMYSSNKVLFDAILLTNFSNSGDRITINDIALISQHSLAVLLASGGSVAAVLGPTGPDRILGVAVAAVGFIKAAQTHIKLRERNLNTIALVFNSILGENERGTNGNELAFENNIATTISLDLAEKKLTTADEAKAKDDIAVFFKDFNKYNYYATKVNAIIQTLNNIPFVNFKQIPLEKMSENVQPVHTDVDQGIFNDITFSIDHPNLSLVSVSLLNTGQISMKIKVIGSPATLPVISTLKYTYKDDYTTFTGSFPIKVKSNPLIGNWKMVIFDETIPVGNYVYTYYPNCPLIWSYKESESGTFHFTETSFNYVWNNSIIMPNFSFNPTTCEVYADNADEENIDTESGSGTYQLNNGTFILSYEGEEEQNPVIFINPDRIKIYDQEFIRVN